MSTQQNSPSTTIGMGNATSGEEGSTPTHETMAETGGSGGSQLTKPRDEEIAASTQSDKVQGDALQGAVDAAAGAEGAGSASTAIARGPQDTRSQQASPGSTGLGTPETGGNQSERDLAPPRKS